MLIVIKCKGSFLTQRFIMRTLFVTRNDCKKNMGEPNRKDLMRGFLCGIIINLVVTPALADEIVRFRLSFDTIECRKVAMDTLCEPLTAGANEIQLSLKAGEDGELLVGEHEVHAQKDRYNFAGKVQVTKLSDQYGIKYRFKLSQWLVRSDSSKPSVQSIVYARKLEDLNQIEVPGWAVTLSDTKRYFRSFLTIRAADSPPRFSQGLREVVQLRANFEFVLCYGKSFEGDMCEIPRSAFNIYTVTLLPQENGTLSGDLVLNTHFRSYPHGRIVRITKMSDSKGAFYQIDNFAKTVNYTMPINKIVVRDMAKLNAISMSHYPYFDENGKINHGILSLGPVSEKQIPSPK